MFFKVPRVYVRVAVKLSPFLIPFAIFASIVNIFDSHAVFVCLTKLVWYPCMATHKLMIL